jgi:adenosylcobinamide-GDP ribazoletransferase
MSGDRPDTAAAVIAALDGAARFLTRLPLPLREPVPLRSTLSGFAPVGAAIGAVTGAILWIVATLGVPPLAAAGIALAVTVLLTGGLHEDGLADTADGFGGGGTRERKLEIMRDSRIGTYGVAALGLMLIVKASALTSLTGASAGSLLLITAAAGGLSRAGMVYLLAALPAARSDGLGAGAGAVPSSLASRILGLSAAAGLLALWIACGLGAAAAALIVTSLALMGLRTLALRQIGGQTGDVCGAAQGVSEALILAVAAASFH